MNVLSQIFNGVSKILDIIREVGYVCGKIVSIVYILGKGGVNITIYRLPRGFVFGL